ncbi:MAG: WbqC family protein [Deltaproteobacteria bacterium]|nr:WbqC family protein [Deltaproteobacteria bacterium]
MNMVDEFILYDDVQYTRRDWRNRNIIKTPDGLKWLTIPVEVKGRYFQKINETRISDPGWSRRHWAAIKHSYSRARHFMEYEAIFEPLYLECAEECLSRVNFRFLDAVCAILGIKTKISWSMDYELVEGRTERLVGLCRAAHATHYISGPSAKDYIDAGLFKDAGIGLSYIDYAGYPEYTQLFGEFEHGVSIVDLIFNEGSDATKYMKSFRPA